MCSDCGTFMCKNLHTYEPNVDNSGCFYYYDNKKGEVKLGHDPSCQKTISAEDIAKQVVELLSKKDDKCLDKTEINGVAPLPETNFRRQPPPTTSLVDMSAELEQKAAIYPNLSKSNIASWDDIKEYIQNELKQSEEKYSEDVHRNLQELQMLVLGLGKKLPLKVQEAEEQKSPNVEIEVIYERPVDPNATYVNIRSRTMGQGDPIRGDLRIAPDSFTGPNWFQVYAKPERDLRKGNMEKTDGLGRPLETVEFLNLPHNS
jgi:hypothetical protein